MHCLNLSPRIIYTILAKHLTEEKLNPQNIWAQSSMMVTGTKTLPQ